MFLLDTNVVSELRKTGTSKANRHVVNWAKEKNPALLYLSVISILEIESGILQLQRRDVRQAELLGRWLEHHVLPAFANRILPIDVAIARRCAGLHVPDRKSERDALIAATALVHGMTVVTRNIRDFAFAGASVFDPWQHAR